jgi:TatD DNase family protein
MGQTNPVLPVHSGVVDTHCHLFLMDQEPTVAVETARAAGVDRLLSVGVDLETSRRSLEMADSLPGVFATAGLHPHDASTFDQASAAGIEELLHDPRVLGVGECGLDFFRMRSPVDAQIEALRVHIAWSNESGKPMVVHVRDAWPETLKVLEEGSASRVVIHCFSGDVDIANECAARGYWMSFAGNVTYPKNEHLRQAARSVPSELLLVETDSPYLAPQILRGRDNAPQNVLFTIEELARVREISSSELAVITADNASRAFPGLRIEPSG